MSNLQNEKKLFETFKNNLYALRKNAIEKNSFSFGPIDSLIYAIVVSQALQYSEEDIQNIVLKMQRSILPQRHSFEKFHSITWKKVSSIMSEQAQTDCALWDSFFSKKEASLFDPIFLVNLQKLKLKIKGEAHKKNYQVRDISTGLSLSNGHFNQSVYFDDLIAEAVWLKKPLETVISSQKANWESHFNSFHFLFKKLPSLFPNIHFTLKKGHICAQYGMKQHPLDHERIIYYAQAQGAGVEDWVKNFKLEDLLLTASPALLILRSKNYLKAYPQALYTLQENHSNVLTLESTYCDQLIPMKKSDNDSGGRLDCLLAEAKHNIYHFEFSAHFISLKQYPMQAFALVGPQISTLSLFPALIKLAAWNTSFSAQCVYLYSDYEDLLIVATNRFSETSLEKLKEQSHILLKHLLPDGTDSISLRLHMELPPYPRGQLKIKEVPSDYFDLLEMAKDISTPLSQSRSFYLKGLASELISSFEEAILFYQKALRLHCTDAEVAHALGRALCIAGRFEEAIPILKRIANLLPNDPQIANTLGLALLQAGHAKQAILILERGTAFASKDVRLMCNLGRCYLADVRLQEAEEILNQALLIAPRFAEAHALLAQIYWKLGNLRYAREHAQKAFVASPSNPSMQDLLWVLSMPSPS